jgi:hypothetical protein
MPPDRDMAEFASQYYAEVLERAQGGSNAYPGVTSVGDFKENVFTQTVLDDLLEAGVLEDAEVCFFTGRLGQGIAKINGYGVGEDEDRIDLLVTIYHSDDSMPSVGVEAVRTACERATRFLRAAVTDKYRDMEPSSEAYAAAARFAELKGQLARARVFLITDGVCSLKEVPVEMIGGLPVSYQIWDMERLFRSLAAGRPHETIEIDLVRDCGRGLPCLSVPSPEDDYRAFLCVVPADVLFHMYDEHGSRLLELNVRSFLQARGKVNKGIRETLRDDPGHFFPYNNGLSMTASEVRVGTDADGRPQIEFIKGLQIERGPNDGVHTSCQKERSGQPVERVRPRKADCGRW